VFFRGQSGGHVLHEAFQHLVSRRSCLQASIIIASKILLAGSEAFAGISCPDEVRISSSPLSGLSLGVE
jgi:hypothetical protein